MIDHYNQKPRRKAEFIRPPNTLKRKVGSGGLSEELLNKAEALLENNAVDFRPLGEMYLEGLKRGIDAARAASDKADPEELIAGMLYPGMQLKANGGMFHYPLVTSLADHLIQFLEVIAEPDAHAVEIVEGFHTTIRAVILGQVKGDGGRYGAELVTALEDACYRYFEKYPENIEASRNAP